MSLLVASNKIQADTAGQTKAEPSQVNGPTAEPPAVIAADLSGIVHLFSDHAGVFASATNALHKATDSIRGPHGGLIPSALQHNAAAAVSRVDGQALAEAVQARGTTFVDTVKTEVNRLRTTLGV